MRKIILNLASSLDGYIARENGDVDWIEGDGSKPNATMKKIGFDKFLESIDIIVMGRRSYEKTRSFAKLSEQFPNKKIFVLSSREIDDEDIEVTKLTPLKLMDNLKGNIWLFGGSELIKSFSREDLIDQLSLSIIPVILGSGIKLFKEGIKGSKWKFISHTEINGITTTNYERRKYESK